MPADCKLCQSVAAPHSDPTFISEFGHSVAFLSYDQDAYIGRAMLVTKAHYDHWHKVPADLQNNIMTEMTKLTAAILKAFGGFRANHISLGNQVPHVHWHIIPRYPDDLNAGQVPIWSATETRLPDEKYQEIAAKIRAAL
jgi:diadenosine tetraphosphate (Ap4A) HIT family hydrolase